MRGADGVPRLFHPSEMVVRPSAVTRLARIAARARTSTDPQDEDLRVTAALRGMGADLAARFGLRYRAIEAEKPGVVAHYGICYQDGLIRIRLRHATTGRPLKRSSLVDTLCHELAHLRHFDHSIRFRRLYLRILDSARRIGYYTPGPERREPRQIALFPTSACGTGRGKETRGSV
jgi:hypothetical protein